MNTPLLLPTSIPTINESTTIQLRHRIRLESLDAFRGLVIAIMILVDDAGPAYNHFIDHSPWNGIRLADFVMPFFLTIVGTSITLSFSNFHYDHDKRLLLRKVVIRAFKLFVLGVVLQGPVVFPTQYDLKRLRIPGILQRIAFSYFMCSCIELLVPLWNHTPTSPSTLWHIFERRALHWIAILLIWITYLMLMFIPLVPGCSRRALLDPPCNAARYWDVILLGQSHLYQTPVYNRDPSCSSCSPGFCLRQDAPNWCTYPYDPEGFVTSLASIGSCFLGVQFGRIFMETQQRHWSTRCQWILIPSLICIGMGVIVDQMGMPPNKNLYSLSYALLMGGFSGIVLVLFHWAVDVNDGRPRVRTAFQPLIWMGKNPIFVFVAAASNVVDIVLSWVYWDTRNNNIVDRARWIAAQLLGDDLGLLLFVILKITFWFLVCGALQRRKIFFKI